MDVTLRKESVDRNIKGNPYLQIGRVALRKESVDRNTGDSVLRIFTNGRSPQGERG